MLTKRFHRWAALAAASYLTGCSTLNPPYLYVKPGTAPGDTIAGVARNALIDVNNFEGWGASVYVSPQRFTKADGTQKFQMIVQLTRSEHPYILIKPGRSLRLIIDGQTFVYATRQGSGPRRSSYRGKMGEKITSESAIYEAIPRDDLERISNARTLDVEIIGKHEIVTARFAEINFSAFQTLLDNGHSITND